MLFAQCSKTAPCKVGACSQYGWCGTGPAYETLCQKDFSAPNTCPPVIAVVSSCPVSVDGTCGLKGTTQFVVCPTGQSCSQWGYCGVGTQFTINAPVVPASCKTVPPPAPVTPPAPIPGTFVNLITPIAQCIQPNHVALTMDDGPSDDITPLVFQKLIANQIPVTFFQVGKNIETKPKGVAAIKTAMKDYPKLFSVAIHTYHHWSSSDIMKNPTKYTSYKAGNGIFVNTADALPYKNFKTGAEILAYEITRTSTIIKNTFGVTPNFLRPPVILIF